MSGDVRDSKHPRRLVVVFYDDDSWNFAGYMNQNDEGDYPQLIHQQKISRHSPKPNAKISRLKRLLMSFRVKPTPVNVPGKLKPLGDEAIVEAHGFVSRNYRVGDQIILLADQGNSGDHLVKAMESLATHLYKGTRPIEPSQIQLDYEENVLEQGLCIYAIAVELGHAVESVSLLNNQLKSRFPPGIEHIKCQTSSIGGSWSCSTIFDPNGGIISREICFYEDSYSGDFI
ncbi:hypothetical protein OPQ81_001138 [Rhizoctonia solani]|nr:hypothetical protein OPQ81_001138 [Rhizoctonia solani]